MHPLFIAVVPITMLQGETVAVGETAAAGGTSIPVKRQRLFDLAVVGLDAAATIGSPVLTKPTLTWPAAEGGTILLADAAVYLPGVYSGYVEELAMGKVRYAETIQEIITGTKR